MKITTEINLYPGVKLTGCPCFHHRRWSWSPPSSLKLDVGFHSDLLWTERKIREEEHRFICSDLILRLLHVSAVKAWHFNDDLCIPEKNPSITCFFQFDSIGFFPPRGAQPSWSYKILHITTTNNERNHPNADICLSQAEMGAENASAGATKQKGWSHDSCAAPWVAERSEMLHKHTHKHWLLLWRQMAHWVVWNTDWENTCICSELTLREEARWIVCSNS